VEAAGPGIVMRMVIVSIPFAWDPRGMPMGNTHASTSMQALGRRPWRPRFPMGIPHRASDLRKEVESVAVVAGPDGAVVDADRELHRRLIGRRAQGAAVADVELRAMQDTLDGAGGG